MTRPNRAARLVLGSATLLGVVVLVHYAVNRPATFGINYRVYHTAAHAARAGADFYAVSPPESGFQYLYPPVTVLVFLPSSLVDSWIPGYLLLSAASLAASGLAARSICRYLSSLGHDLPTPDRVFVGAFIGLSSYAASSLAYGQVNHLLVSALVVGLVRLARGRERRAGVLLAIPAFVKLFPAALGLWLLRRRSWRAIGAAVGTAVGLTVLGLLAFGADTYRTYVFDALLSRRDSAAFAGGLDPGAQYATLRRPLSVAFPAVDPGWYAVGAAAVLAPVLALLYWRLSTATDRHVAIHGTLVATVLWFPSLPLYYAYLAFPLVVLLYDLPAGRGRRLFVAGALLANVSLSFNNLRQVVRVLPVGSGASATITDALQPVLTVATPTTIGCLLMLGGCILYRVESGSLTIPEAIADEG